MTVLFSVVTVVRNDLIGLKKTRESLEKQKYKNWIHIVIDGASGQATQKYLNTLNKKNTIYVSEIDYGIYDAMNKAWKIANPKSFVLYLNARDVFADTNSLTEANKALKSNPRINWGCTTHEEIQENGEGWVCKLVSPPRITNQLYAFGYRSHQAVVMKAKFIAQLGGFNEHYKIAADWDLIARAINLSKPKIWIHSLGRFELGGESSNRILEAHLELKMIRRKYLIRSLKYQILDDLWCAIYLRYFGYKNYFLPIQYFVRLKFRRKKRKLNYKLIQNNFGKFHLKLGIFSIYITTIIKINHSINNLYVIRRLNESNNKNFIFWLHNKLHIEPYSALPPTHHVRKYLDS